MSGQVGRKSGRINYEHINQLGKSSLMTHSCFYQVLALDWWNSHFCGNTRTIGSRLVPTLRAVNTFMTLETADSIPQKQPSQICFPRPKFHSVQGSWGSFLPCILVHGHHTMTKKVCSPPLLMCVSITDEEEKFKKKDMLDKRKGQLEIPDNKCCCTRPNWEAA